MAVEPVVCLSGYGDCRDLEGRVAVAERERAEAIKEVVAGSDRHKAEKDEAARAHKVGIASDQSGRSHRYTRVHQQYRFLPSLIRRPLLPVADWLAGGGASPAS